MSSIKEFNVKLNRLKNTRKMTQTMKLVSMSKLVKAQEAQRRSKLYADRLTDLISRLAATSDVKQHPLLNSINNKNHALILLVTSDRGLCGGFNNALIRSVNYWLFENGSNYQQVDFSFCGRRGQTHFKSKYPQKAFYANVTAKPNFLEARQIGVELSNSFLNGEYRDIFIAYNKFISPLSQKPVLEKVLPIEAKPLISQKTPLPTNYLFEPDIDQLISFLIPKYLYFVVYYALLENGAGEHAARMTAMESATKNTDDLIGSLTMIRNRARQADITAELNEIITGAESLNQ
jgi:F-type H+-transporting ATPase subunit gamma